MPSIRAIIDFVKNESGTITLDWFALTFGAIALTFGVVTAIAKGQTDVADWIVQQVELAATE